MSRRRRVRIERLFRILPEENTEYVNAFMETVGRLAEYFSRPTVGETFLPLLRLECPAVKRRSALSCVRWRSPFGMRFPKRRGCPRRGRGIYDSESYLMGT